MLIGVCLRYALGNKFRKPCENYGNTIGFFDRNMLTRIITSCPKAS